MQKVTICRGIPGSGKSTFANELVLKSNGKTKRVNKDELRVMIDAGKHSKDREKTIVAARDVLIATYLGLGFDVVVDDTNLEQCHIDAIKLVAATYKAQVSITNFTKPLQECLHNNRHRTDKEPVPEQAIFGMWKRHYYDPHKYNNANLSPTAYVCDLDGTLCNLNGRNPYDASTCENDLPNGALIEILQLIDTDTPNIVIFVSGRHDTYREQTEAWLKNHYGGYYILHMRKAGDDRSDTIIKREIYHEFIEPNYYVKLWFDDRPKVIDMVRYELMLPVADVGFGIPF